MKNERVFYDLSQCEEGWYAQVFNIKGEDLYTTETYATKRAAVKDVKAKYPTAEILMEFPFRIS